MPNCLRIITKDFRNNRFPAATLRDRTWLLLQEQLEMKGIIVRNECISGGEKINRKPGNDN
jgi:hypothetical protein